MFDYVGSKLELRDVLDMCDLTPSRSYDLSEYDIADVKERIAEALYEAYEYRKHDLNNGDAPDDEIKSYLVYDENRERYVFGTYHKLGNCFRLWNNGSCEMIKGHIWRECYEKEV